MRHARLVLLLPALFTLGCPGVGDWDEPLGPVRGGHIDSKLLGDWRCTSEDDKTPGRVSIVAFDKNQYVIAVASLDGKEKTTYHRAFTTTVSGHDVMNVKELDADPGDGAWIYTRFHQPRAGQLGIELLKTEPLDGTPDDVESRRQAIGDLYLEAALWQGFLRCVPFEAASKDEPASKAEAGPAASGQP
jgi:hypothetical protein